MAATEKPRTKVTSRRFIVRDTQSPPARRCYVVRVHGDVEAKLAYIDAYDVLALRTFTYIECSIRHPDEGPYPVEPVSTAEAHRLGWRLSPPETEVEPIIADDDYGLLSDTFLIGKVRDSDHRLVVVRGAESDDEQTLIRAGLAMIDERGEAKGYNPKEFAIHFSFSPGVIPFQTKLVDRDC